MAVWKIIRIYEVPGETEIQATDRMAEALVLHVDKDFHIADYIREAENKEAKSQQVDLTPPPGWLAILRSQLLGESAKKR
jgi:hypothetical protein